MPPSARIPSRNVTTAAIPEPLKYRRGYLKPAPSLTHCHADFDESLAVDGEPARCRIELKGNWNRDLMTAMRSQLADDYLLPEGLQHGVYVTAWFDTQHWNDSSDNRRQKAASRDRENTARELDAQAESLRGLGLQVHSVVLDIPHPRP